jgi:hypothetical protein
MSPSDASLERKDNPHSLLEEGADSYPEALTALTDFRRQVQSACARTIEQHLTDYSEALGVQLDKNDIDRYAAPENEFNGSSAVLGAKHRISRRRETGVGCVSYCCVSWVRDREKPWFGCSVSVWFNRREIAESLYSAFQRSGAKLPAEIELGIQPNEVYLCLALKRGDMGSLRERLDEVMTAWVRLWKEFGGLNALEREKP